MPRSMRDEFPASYRPSQSELETLLREAVVSFDASVLPNVYEYGSEAREQFFAVLNHLCSEDRLWLTFQAAAEFHGRRETVILRQQGSLRRLVEPFKDLDKALNSEHAGRAPDERQRLKQIAEGAATQAQEVISESTRSPKIDADQILQGLTDIIGDRFGSRPEKDEFEKRRTEAKQRIKDRIPPGYEDADKEENPEGDFLIWRELLDYAKGVGRPILFVTDDRKPDW